jgi:hypothetical protein
MKNTFLKSLGLVVLSVVVLTTFASREALSNQDGGGRLDGTWDVQLTVRNCQTGGAIRTFPEVVTFMSGGTMIDSTSGRAQALKTPGQGVWNHVSGNTYQFRFKHFNFDTTGNFVGWTIVSQVATLSPDAIEYTSEGTAENYDATGALISSGCSTTIAARFQ